MAVAALAAVTFETFRSCGNARARSVTQLPTVREMGLVALASVFLAVALTWRLVLAHGWIGMRQDWAAMPFQGQFALWAAGERSGWLQLGIGERSVYPFDWLLLTLLQPLSMLLPASALSKAGLLAVLAISSYGYYVCARSAFGFRWPSAIGAALFAVANPVIFNKAASGQLAYLWAYALLPIWFTFYRRARISARWEWALLAGVVAAVMSSQIQFVAIILVIGILDVIFLQVEALGPPLTALLLTLAVVLLVQGSTLVMALGRIGDLLRTTQTVGSLDWISASSAPLRQTMALGGYVVKYLENGRTYLGIPLAPARAISAAWVVAITGIVIVGRKVGPVRFAGMAWLIGALLTAGTDIPGGSIIAFAYLHIVAMQAFRELYHWAAISAFGGAVLIAFGIERCLQIPKLGRIAVACLIMVSVANVAPVLTGNWGAQIQNVVIDRGVTREYSVLQESHAFARVLWLPADQPMQAAGASFAGTDPMAFSTPYSLWQYVPTPPLAPIITAFRARKTAGIGHLLRYSGVTAIVIRHGIRSRIPDFAYRRYAIFRKTFANGSNLAGVTKLHWKPGRHNASLAVFHAPHRAGIVASASGVALVSPSVLALRNVHEGLSPTMRALSAPIASTVLEGGDVATSEAMAIPHARDFLKLKHLVKSGDAAIAWAPIAAWWYYRFDFDDALDAKFVTFAPGAELRIGPVRVGDTIIVSYLATSHGGSLGVRLPGGAPKVVRTRQCCVPALRARVFTARVSGDVRITDIAGEQILRHVYDVGPSAWRVGVDRISSEVRNARNVVVTVVGREYVTVVRTGLYRTIGILRIDGRKVGATAFLKSGVYLVRASPSGGELNLGDINGGALPRPTAVRATMDGLVVRGVVPPNVGALRLRMAYSRAWRLRLAGSALARHEIGDLFSNLWTFPQSDHPRTFEITNRGALLAIRLHWISLVMLGMVFLVSVIGVALRNEGLGALEVRNGHAQMEKPISHE